MAYRYLVECLEEFDKYELVKFFIPHISLFSNLDANTRLYLEAITLNRLGALPLRDFKVKIIAGKVKIISGIWKSVLCDFKKSPPKKHTIFSIFNTNKSIVKITKRLLPGFNIHISANTSKLNAIF